MSSPSSASDPQNPDVIFKALEPYKDREVHKFPVIEIFGPTIQGEGSMVGVKTMFVRFGGCDYKCAKCDSLHAVIPQAVKKHATWMYTEEIFLKLFEAKRDTGVEWVTISGGNPAMWDLQLLVELCKEAGIKVAVETQGSIWREWLGDVDMLTVCPKGPGMGERFNREQFEKFLEQVEGNYNRLTGRLGAAMKVVIFHQQDLEFAVALDEILNCRQSGFWPKHDRYMSLGNPYPPVLNDQLELEDPGILKELNVDLPSYLMARYRDLLEMDYLNDPRLAHWKFLPQLHVLVWANKPGV